MTLKSSIVSSIDTWKNRGRILLTRFVYSPMISIVHVVWLALVLLVLVPWLALDFLPKRKPRPLTTSNQPIRKLQHPEREGSDVYVVNPDGSRILLEPLEVSIMAEKWLSVVKGAYVYEKTRLRGDTGA